MKINFLEDKKLPRLVSKLNIGAHPYEMLSIVVAESEMYIQRMLLTDSIGFSSISSIWFDLGTPNG